MSTARVCVAFFIGFLLMLSAAGAQQASLSGRVYDAQNGQGVPGLTIQLAPPKAEGDHSSVAYTESDGRFKVPGLRPGRYLLTVSQGPTLLYREEVEVTGETVKDISLQRG